MAISTHFQSQINAVDATKTLVFVSGAGGYDDLEWSYNGLTVSGGSDAACEIGAAALLDAMGFRAYFPDETRGYVQPASIPTGLTQAKTEDHIPSKRIFLVYGHPWAGSKVASRNLLTNAQTKWQVLNGVNLDSYPAGHRWSGIRDNYASYFTANPTFLRFNTGSSGVKTFNLAGLQGTAGWTTLATFCAAVLLKEGLNEFGRTHFDPIDQDTNSSDLVYSFSKLVNDIVLVGTAQIDWAGGSIPAQAGRPDAEIGVYAYAQHRLPPALPYDPVYSQVALAFNRTALTYSELITAHAALGSAIGLREYMATQAWDHGKPALNKRNKFGYLAELDDLVTAGVRGINSEFSANWLVNMVQARWTILYYRHGTVNEQAVLEELVADVFDDDPKVLELYERWLDPLEKFTLFNIKAWMDIVDDMVAGWYKTAFQQLLTIYWKLYRVDRFEEYGITVNPLWELTVASATGLSVGQSVTQNNGAGGTAVGEIYAINGTAITVENVTGVFRVTGSTGTNWTAGQFTNGTNSTNISVAAVGDPAPDDEFADEMNTLLSWVTALRDSNYLHSYAFIRQKGNTFLTKPTTTRTNYPQLMFDASPEPDWMANSAAPSNADWTAAYAEVAAEATRDPNLEGSDLVLKVVTPLRTGSVPQSGINPDLPATKYFAQGAAEYVVIGPTTLTVTDKTDLGNPFTVEFDEAGVHTFETDGQFYVEGEKAFLDAETVRKDPDGGGRFHWMYVPQSAAGSVDIRPASRWSFYDEEGGRKDWLPSRTFPDLGPGQCIVDNVQTTNTVELRNVNRYISQYPNVALMPRALAVAEGATCRMTVAA